MNRTCALYGYVLFLVCLWLKVVRSKVQVVCWPSAYLALAHLARLPVQWVTRLIGIYGSGCEATMHLRSTYLLPLLSISVTGTANWHTGFWDGLWIDGQDGHDWIGFGN